MLIARNRRTMKKRKITFFKIVFSCVALFFLCEDGNAYETIKDGGSIVLATTTDPKTFNPILAQETSSSQILQYIFDGLTRTDPHSGEVIPHLAYKWEHDDTHLVWTFYLRDDVYWNDGKAFTAYDVSFTFNDVIYNPDIISSLRSIFTINGKPIKVEVVDKHTVRFVLPAPFAPLARALGVSLLPKHILESSIKDGTFNTVWTITEKAENIVGTGPFRLHKYIPGEMISLQRNQFYWKHDDEKKRLPYCDRLIFQIVQSPDLALLKFKNQEIDVYALRAIDYAWLKRYEKKGYFTIYNMGPTTSRSLIVVNQNTDTNPNTGQPYVDPKKQKWFTEKKVRQAIAHAINKEAIIDIVYHGLAQKQHAILTPASGYFHNDTVKRYEYDPQMSKRLLSEVGFSDVNEDGILEDSDAQRISFSLMINSGSTQGVQIANLVRKDLQEIGFDVHILQVEFNTMASKLFYSFDWEMMLMGMTGGMEPHFGANVWLSNGPFHMWHPRQHSPQRSWEQRIDEIFNEAVSIIDKEKRKELYDEWQMIVSDELPVIVTVVPLNIVAVNNRLGNISPSSYGGVLHTIEEIYIKKECEGNERTFTSN